MNRSSEARRVDALVLLAAALILLGLWLSARRGFDASWTVVHACDARHLPDGLARCVAIAPWLHLSATHAVVNLAVLLLLWRRLRSGTAGGVALAGIAGSVLGMTAASLLFGVPVAGSSALVHGLLGRCFVQAKAPLAAVDLFAAAGLLALGASAPTWSGHLVATSAGAAVTMLLATNLPRR